MKTEPENKPLIEYPTIYTFKVMGRQEHMGWAGMLRNALVTGSFGLAILALKILVH